MTIRHDCARWGCWLQQAVPDWGFLQGCFPRGGAPSDLDGLRYVFPFGSSAFTAQPDDDSTVSAVEVGGRFLVLEWKRPNPAGYSHPSVGQNLMLHRIAKDPRWTVLALRGPLHPVQTVQQARVIDPAPGWLARVLEGTDDGWRPADDDRVREFCTRWSGGLT